MKITFVGHASILIETHGLRILSDPWWRGPCFGAQWWPYPPPRSELVTGGVDYVYISHGHHDHLHPGTLRTLDRNAICLVSRRVDIAQALRDLGFQVVEFDDDTNHELASGVRCRIIETHASDTLFAIDDGQHVCVNLNDSLHSAPIEVQDRFIALLKSLYPRIDFLFCGYGAASHFPNCYEIPGKNREATAARRQAHFNLQWARIVAGLSPTFAFPFAADVAFLETDLLWSNEPTHNAERPTTVFSRRYPQASTTVVDIGAGFTIEDGTVTREVLRKPMSISRLREEYAENVERANSYGTVAQDVFDDVLQRLSANVERCLPFLREHRGDYRFLIRFRNFATGISIVKRDRSITVAAAPGGRLEDANVTYVTRLHYVRWSLSSRYGHEILFVGSGGIFCYSRAEDARRNLHRELAVMLVPHETCPPSRFGASSRGLFLLKRAIKRGLGRSPEDLYDLATWTVWKRPDQAAEPQVAGKELER
jgi:L-ascorbate metabolism protein UlaG (beta-lactamase superfamily)